MVEDIRFPKTLSPVTSTGRVQRGSQKKREQERTPFKKFLDDREQKKKKRKKESNRDEPPGETEKIQPNSSVGPSGSTKPAETEDDSEKKIIDVHA